MNKIAIVVVALVLSLAGGCSSTEQRAEVEFRVPVSVEDVTTGRVEDRIVATGTLRAPEVVTLTVETQGLLRFGRNAAGRRLAEGDTVAAGQTIAEVLGEDVRLAARTEATERRYRTAVRDHESTAALYEEGLITELDFRAVEDRLAEARLEWERSMLTEQRTRLITPIAGVIQRLGRDEAGAHLADGQLVVPGYAVAQVAPIEQLIADIDLIGADFARVAVGQQARVRHHAWEGRTFDAEVIRLAPALDPVTRSFRAEVEIDNRDHALRPGMFVEVTLIAEQRDDVPIVPREAVTQRGGTRVVFVLRGQEVVRRNVVLGLGDDDVVEIRQGLEPGERVVVKGLETLTDGTRVRVSGS